MRSNALSSKAGRSTAQHAQTGCRLLRRDQGRRAGSRGRGRAHVAAGDVKRRNLRIGILRQPSATPLDQARLRKTALRSAAVAQDLRGVTQFARQHYQSAVEVDAWADNLDRPGDALLRARRDDAVRRGDEFTRVDRDVAAIAGLALDRSRDLAVLQSVLRGSTGTSPTPAALVTWIMPAGALSVPPAIEIGPPTSPSVCPHGTPRSLPLAEIWAAVVVRKLKAAGGAALKVLPSGMSPETSPRPTSSGSRRSRMKAARDVDRSVGSEDDAARIDQVEVGAGNGGYDRAIDGGLIAAGDPADHIADRTGIAG